MRFQTKTIYSGLMVAMLMASSQWVLADDETVATSSNTETQDNRGIPTKTQGFLKQDSSMLNAMKFMREMAMEQSHPYLRKACAADDQECDPRTQSQRDRSTVESRNRHSCRD